MVTVHECVDAAWQGHALAPQDLFCTFPTWNRLILSAANPRDYGFTRSPGLVDSSYRFRGRDYIDAHRPPRRYRLSMPDNLVKGRTAPYPCCMLSGSPVVEPTESDGGQNGQDR